MAPAAPLPHEDPRDLMPLLLQSLCDRGAQVQPTNLIVTKTGSGYRSITYQEHQARTLCLASALERWGVRIGDRVATFLWNNAWHLQCYHAISCMGAVLHTLNVRLSPQDQAYIISHAGDRVIFADADLLELLAKTDVEVLDNIELYVCVGEDGREGAWTRPDALPLDKCVDFESFLATGYYRYRWPDFPETSPHSLCYTSGTTGVPKGVTYSHRSTYLHTVMTMLPADQYGISGSMVVLPYVPMFHVLSWGVPFATLMLGTRTIFTHRFTGPEALLDTMIRWKVEVTTGVPLIWQGLRSEILQRGAQTVSDLSLKMIISGGSAPPTDLMGWYDTEMGVDFVQGWGMTETNPSGTLARRVSKHSDLKKTVSQQFENVTKCGLPVPGVEMRIANPVNFDEDMPNGEAGELLVRGPWIITKYFQLDAADKFHKGWLVTGDIAFFDEDGSLILADRSKDAIKSGGEWISSIDLENFVAALDIIETSAVVGVSHPKWEERPIAVVTLNPEVVVSAADLLERVRSHCLTKFAKFQLPDDVLVWDALPIQSTGKIDKKAIRDRLSAEGYMLPSQRAELAPRLTSENPLAASAAHSKL